ncbi:MAG: hypothetical protein RBT76_07585 [candidate division Zixibacteria bacterium]|jgi:hypothetical protein|nr:hypothetical protein [candidate division Zixibacteria bacterium]
MTAIERMLIPLFERLLARPRSAKSNASPGAGRLQIGEASALTDCRVIEPFAIELSDLQRHAVSLGSSGGGKTSLIFVFLVNLLMHGYGGLMVDIHDAVPKFLSLAARLVTTGVLPKRVLSRILVVSFDDQAPLVRFNPLAKVTWAKPHRVGQHMELMLRRQWPEATWGAPSSELIANTFCLMAEHGLPLTMTEPLLRNPALLHHHCQTVRNEACRNYFLNRWLHLSDAMRDFYTQVFLPRLSTFLADPKLRVMFGSNTSDLDLFQCLNDRMLVLFDLNKGILGRDAELVASIILAVEQQAAFARLPIPEPERHLSTLIIDEFNALAGVHEIIAPALNEFRKLKIPVLLSGQSLTGMDRAMRSTILTNCAVRCCFRMDAENLKTVTAELQGEERELLRSRIARLGVGEAMVFVGGKPARQVSVDYLPIPEKLSRIEEQMVRQMYRNVGGVTWPPASSDEHSSFGEPPKSEPPKVNELPASDADPDRGNHDLPPGYREGGF